IVRWRSLSPSTALLTCPTRSFASNCCSTVRSPLGNHSLASSNATALFCVRLQNCIRRLRQWSFCRLMAMRISQVRTLDSPRKLDQFRCAFRKQSWVSVSARSRSRVDDSRNRKICGRCLATTAENSSAALSSAMAMVIGSNVAQAAITLVDARTGCKFTAPKPFSYQYKKQGGGQNRPLTYPHSHPGFAWEMCFALRPLKSREAGNASATSHPIAIHGWPRRENRFQKRKPAGLIRANCLICRVTGFSRSIPFFIGSLPFIVFLGENAWNTVDISRGPTSLTHVFSIACPSLLNLSLFFTHGNRRATEQLGFGCFPDGDKSLQPLSGDTAGPSHGRAGAAGCVEFSTGAPLPATRRRRLVARGG